MEAQRLSMEIAKLKEIRSKKDQLEAQIINIKESEQSSLNGIYTTPQYERASVVSIKNENELSNPIFDQSNIKEENLRLD